MIGRKFEPGRDQYSEHSFLRSAEKTSTLPALNYVNSVNSSPKLPNKSIYLRSKSVANSQLSTYERLQLFKARKSLENEAQLMQPGERAMALIGSPISKQNSSDSELNHDANGDQEQDESSTEKVKVKLMSLWHNVKYGWQVKLRTSFNHETPIWLLGVMYHRNLVDPVPIGGPSNRNFGKHRPSISQQQQQQLNKESALDLFRHDYYSRIWFTYRRNFARLDQSTLTSDCGWGCMIRSGQMMLAQAFLCHYLGRNWRWMGTKSDKNDMIHRMIVKWFIDEPDAPFSLHKLVKISAKSGKKPGDWFGPATISHVLSDALNEGFLENPILENVACYVAQDCTIYLPDVYKLCTEDAATRRSRSASIASSASPFDAVEEQLRQQLIRDQPSASTSSPANKYEKRKNSNLIAAKAASTCNLYETSPLAHCSSSASSATADSGISTLRTGIGSRKSSKEQEERWRGVLLLIPVRLGGDKFNPIYTDRLKALFTQPTCMGVIGGRPRHSLFFIGYQEDKLIYLDPHFCQDALNATNLVDFPLDSFHCNDPRKMSIQKMDPSCTLAFYCRNKLELDELAASAREFLVPGHKHTDYPIFIFSNEPAPSVQPLSDGSRLTERVLKVRHRYLDKDGNVESEGMSEDFILIT